MNKIIVSILFAIILVFGINKITDSIFYVEKPEKSAYQVTNVTTVASTTASETSSDSGNIMLLFASTSAADGAKVFKKCAACHSIAEGGANKIGPGLWDIVNKDIGSKDDYKYSSAMAAFEGDWTFEQLNNYLINPKKYIKGTKMSFVGLKKAKDRANVILYLRSFSDNPAPIE